MTDQPPRDFGATVRIDGHRLLVATLGGTVTTLHTSEVHRALMRIRDIERDLLAADAYLNPPDLNEILNRG